MDNSTDAHSAVASTAFAQEEVLRPLLAAAANGCQASFATLYERTHRRMFGIVIRIVRHRGEAEEVLQDMYVKIWSRSAQFNLERGLVMFWLASVARNTAIDARRRASRRPQEFSADIDDTVAYSEIASSEASPADLLARRQTSSLVHAQLRALPGNERLCLGMAFFDGMTHHEIAEKLACPLGTIKSRIRRSLMSMREPLVALQ